jgi:hypothetical protein
MRGQRAGIDPVARAQRTEQFAFAGIDLDFLAQVRRQRHPATFAAQAVAAGEQGIEVEAGVFAGFQQHHRTTAHAHAHLLVDGGHATVVGSSRQG